MNRHFQAEEREGETWLELADMFDLTVQYQVGIAGEHPRMPENTREY